MSFHSTFAYELALERQRDLIRAADKGRLARAARNIPTQESPSLERQAAGAPELGCGR